MSFFIYFFILLTVHLSIILVINQLAARFCASISLITKIKLHEHLTVSASLNDCSFRHSGARLPVTPILKF
jgi:hypothetical protein